MPLVPTVIAAPLLLFHAHDEGARASAFEVGARGQFMYSATHEPEEARTRQRLQLRRARVLLGGYPSDDVELRVELGFSPADLDLDEQRRATPLLDAYVDFNYLRDASVRVGQYKLPYSRQRAISSGDLQLVERSLANGEFSLDRDLGVALFSEDLAGLDRLQYSVGVYQGEGRDAFAWSDFGLLYMARFEVLPLGIFDDEFVTDFERRDDPALSLGLGYAYHDDAQRDRGGSGATPADGGTTNMHHVTADVLLKCAGFSMFWEGYARRGRRVVSGRVAGDASVEPPRDGVGMSVQTGYMLPPMPLELVARASTRFPFDERSSLRSRTSLQGGLSWYIDRHPLKLQFQYEARFASTAIARSQSIVVLQLQAEF
jgi:phosphate-selective porin OprO and OprP